MSLPFGIEGPAKRPSVVKAYARGLLGVVSIISIVGIGSFLAGYFSARF